MSKLWSYSTGIPGLSRVRVYERRPGGPLHIEFTGGDRQTLSNLANRPIVDHTLATKIANKLSNRLERTGTRQSAREVLGLAAERTLSQLTARYHADRGDGWSQEHRRHQERLRDWWLERLGPRTLVYQVKEADVEAAVRKHGTEWAKRTRQKYLRYVMALYNYAHRKLRWIKEEDALRGVDMPKPSRGGPSYSHPEMIAMLRKAPDVDLRASAALEIAYDTQARSRALLHLGTTDVSGPEVTFHAAYDKAGQARVAVLSPSARKAVERLLEAHSGSEWLFEDDGGRMGYDQLLRLLRAVEKAAGVAHVKGRGWHAVKRRAVTDARQAVGDMGAVSKQSGTLASTLERIYEQDDMEPKRGVAEAMEQLRRSAG